MTRDQLDPEGQAAWDRIAADRGSVRIPSSILLHHPPLAERVSELGSQLRFHGVLSGADRELVILTAGRETRAPYQNIAHEPLGLSEGLRPEPIEVLKRNGPTDGLEPREALIIDAVRSLFRHYELPAELYDRLEAELGRKALVELVVLCGYYSLTGFVLNAFEVEMPPGVSPAFER